MSRLFAFYSRMLFDELNRYKKGQCLSFIDRFFLFALSKA